jgi:hypothetical protein
MAASTKVISPIITLVESLALRIGFVYLGPFFFSHPAELSGHSAERYEPDADFLPPFYF